MPPADNFRTRYDKLCTEEGPFILDEMITGFRWHIGGAQAFSAWPRPRVKFGKGWRTVSRRCCRQAQVQRSRSISIPGAERTFSVDDARWRKTSGLGAFIETVRIYQQEDVCGILWRYGARLRDGMNDLANAWRGAVISMDGPAICVWNYLTRDAAGAVSTRFRTLFSQEMVRNAS